MITVAQIKWGSYQGFEGPFFSGTIPYAPETNPDFLGKVVSVVCATEGGRYDAINMYDSCIISVGILQVCERVLEMSNMLSLCAKYDLAGLNEAFAKLPNPLEMRKSSLGPMRLYFKDGSGCCDTAAAMRKAYFGGGTGLKGQWTDDQKAWAREVAVVFANMWESGTLRRAQLEYVKGRMFGFALPRARQGIMANPNKESWSGAMQAMYLSYAANLPSVADKCLAKATSNPKWATATDESKYRILSLEMVRSGVDIWPGRYRHIQPTVASLFGVKAPKLEELTALTHAPALPEWILSTPQDVQKALIKLGYDLGPAGADGVFGHKTKMAITSFQAKHGLDTDGVVGPLTKAKLAEAVNALR